MQATKPTTRTAGGPVTSCIYQADLDVYVLTNNPPRPELNEHPADLVDYLHRRAEIGIEAFRQ